MIPVDPHTKLCCPYRFCAAASPKSPATQRFRNVRRGDHLCVDLADLDDGGAFFFIPLDAALGVCATLEDGRRQIIDIELAGGALVAPPCDDSADFTVEALSDGRVCTVEIAAEPGARGDAARTLMSDVSRGRMARRSAHIAALGRLDGMERMSLFLADVARRVGRSRNGALHVSLPLSRDDIADYLGLNAETVSRLFSRIKKSGLAVFTSPTEFVVPDLDALERRTPLKPSRRDRPRLALAATNPAQAQQARTP